MSARISTCFQFVDIYLKKYDREADETIILINE